MGVLDSSPTGKVPLFLHLIRLTDVSRDSSVGTVTRLWTEWSGFESLQEKETFSSAKNFRPALGPISHPIQQVLGGVGLLLGYSGRDLNLTKFIYY